MSRWRTSTLHSTTRYRPSHLSVTHCSMHLLNPVISCCQQLGARMQGLQQQQSALLSCYKCFLGQQSRQAGLIGKFDALCVVPVC